MAVVCDLLHAEPHACLLARPALEHQPFALLARIVHIIAPVARLPHIVPIGHVAVVVFHLLLVRMDKEPLHQQLAQYTWSTR